MTVFIVLFRKLVDDHESCEIAKVFTQDYLAYDWASAHRSCFKRYTVEEHDVIGLWD